MADQVNAVQGEAAQAEPRPGPIPRRQQRFRPATQLNAARAPVVPAFPVSVGLPPILSYADGYSSVEIPFSGLNTYVPSYLNLASRVFLTNQRLCANDKFLKEQALYDPRALDLYCSFLFMYHSLRVRSEVGNLSEAEVTLLTNLRFEYPESSLPVPGTIADNLMSITTTENPYSWLGHITATVPSNNQYQAGAQGYLVANNLHLIYPSPPMLISQIYARVALADRPTDDTARTLSGNIYSLARTRVTTANPERFWLQTPHARFPDPATPRTIQAFYDSVRGQAAEPYLNRFVLDLPVLNTNTSTAHLTLPSYMGLIDAEGVANRRMSFLRWPSQLANMAGTICKYISGSRHLSDIATTGLGAQSPVCRFTRQVVFEDRDPTVIQGSPPAAADINVYNSFFMTSFHATLRIRDPVISDLATQFAMITQINIDTEGTIRNDGNPTTAVIASRVGEFWEYPVCEYGPESAVANILVAHLPNFVRSNPRRDNAD